MKKQKEEVETEGSERGEEEKDGQEEVQVEGDQADKGEMKEEGELEKENKKSSRGGKLSGGGRRKSMRIIKRKLEPVFVDLAEKEGEKKDTPSGTGQGFAPFISISIQEELKEKLRP